MRIKLNKTQKEEVNKALKHLIANNTKELSIYLSYNLLDKKTKEKIDIDFGADSSDKIPLKNYNLDTVVKIIEKYIEENFNYVRNMVDRRCSLGYDSWINIRGGDESWDYDDVLIRPLVILGTKIPDRDVLYFNKNVINLKYTLDEKLKNLSKIIVEEKINNLKINPFGRSLEEAMWGKTWGKQNSIEDQKENEIKIKLQSNNVDDVYNQIKNLLKNIPMELKNPKIEHREDFRGGSEFKIEPETFREIRIGPIIQFEVDQEKDPHFWKINCHNFAIPREQLKELDIEVKKPKDKSKEISK